MHKDSDTQKNISPHFKKRSGTTDRGKDYEHLFIAEASLKLLKDAQVEDFYISSNDEKFGSFDDVVLEIKHHNIPDIHTYALQLKHKKNNVLKIEDLTAKKGNFSISEYYKHTKLEGPVKTILFTNCKLQKNSNEFQVILNETVTVDVVIETSKPEDLVNTAPNGQCYKFKSDPKYENFFENFFLYVGQSSSEHLRTKCLDTFQRMYQCDESVFNEYLTFLTNWSMIEDKKEKLTKSWIKRVIVHQVLSPFIKPLSFQFSNVEKKQKMLQNAMSNFKVTILGEGGFDKVRRLWRDAALEVDMKELNKICRKYSVGSKYIEKIDDSVEISKLLWLMDKCPLVVEGDPKTLPAIDLSDLGRFVIVNPQMQLAERPHFQQLSHLKNEEPVIFEDIVNNFTFSLEGQRETLLKVLLHQDEEFENIITTDHLVQMLVGPLVIGEVKEVLPSYYVARTMSRIMIKLQYLSEFHENTVVIISQVQNLEMFKSRFKQLKIVVIGTKEECGDGNKVIYVCQEECTQEAFEELCSQGVNCHHFRYFSEGLEWIRSKNGVEELRNFQINDYKDLTESELFDSSSNLVNVICENPGMGKTVLMKSLKINRKCWTIMIYSRNHGSYFRKNGPDVEHFLNYIVDANCKHYTTFDRTVYKKLARSRNFELIWDGLDEVSDTTLRHITSVIHGITKKGHKQWITSRNNLVQRLEREFGVFSRSVHQFKEEEQKSYIRDRLSCSEDELSSIFEKIQSNIQLFPKNTILGIPLQIYMITELFFENIDKYLALLSQIFTVADLYEHFVHKIIYDNYKEKKDFNFDIDANWDEFEEKKITMLEHYQRIALQVYFEDDPQIPLSKDAIGFIVNVGDGNGQFLHNSYGEYFAALFFTKRENFAKIPPEFYVDEWFNNIRFFRDLILAQSCKAHIAVLYKNPQLLEQCAQNDILQKDAAGRSSFQVSCTWSKKYPRLETMKRSNYYFITNTAIYNLSKGDFEHFDPNDNSLPSKFDKICDLTLRKILLLFPFMTPFWESIFDEFHVPSLLYYAVKFDYDLVFKSFDQIPFIKISNSSTTLLDFAIESLAFNCITHLMSNQLYKSRVFEDEKCSFKICILQSTKLLRIFENHGWDINQLHRGIGILHYICNHGGDLTPFNFLLQNGIQINKPDENGKLPIHYACLKNDMYLVELLLMNGARGDIPDENGKTVINYACKSEEYGPSILKLLFQSGLKSDQSVLIDAVSHHGIEIVKILVDNADISDGNQLLHHACKNERNGYEIIKFLLGKGVKVDKPDSDGKLLIHLIAERGWADLIQNDNVNVCDNCGKMPIHYACSGGHFTIVEVLIQNGATVNVCDNCGKMPIHYACSGGHFTIVEALIQNGAKVNVCDDRGKTPIHYACQSESTEIVALLIQNGATVNAEDGEGILPIYSSTRSDIIKLLIQNGANVNMPYPDGTFLIHFAALRGWTSDIAMFLIQQGTDLNIYDKYNQTALHYACRYGRLEITNLLLQNGAKLTYDADDQTPIHYACRLDSFDVLELFIQSGANINIPGKFGKMPIHIASELGNIDILKNLIQHGCEIEIQDNKGLYPIHYACRNPFNGDQVVKILILNEANVNVVDHDGKFPIHYACQNEDYGYDIVRIIFSRQDIISLEDYKTLFDYVCKNRLNGFEIGKFLIKMSWLGVVMALVQKGVNRDIIDSKGRRRIDCVPKDSLHYKEFLRVLQNTDQI
ncbi:uncharacterized protein LOC103314755 [Tribolium castaneum]|uniref:Uncharacterized protein n=1 Tax=Tribolium castaneum TaxID=7070 RepID=D2CFZ6_TRICA|nr:PREDICTED: uncharacterized protein LOC103314755 [Tribolium castaneum]XP_015837820.1 PREDICTED: uncharacterized protein LOC103314755 [Tribolium castaneum]EFA11849.2 hypothetical protein TcasGA2_TC005089 [Tribolium castaneum]|eukprot:XP_008199798.1 PREDICTED: uncharacterized protein LOC103314755 [Tribolium castaneum]